MTKINQMTITGIFCFFIVVNDNTFWQLDSIILNWILIYQRYIPILKLSAKKCIASIKTYYWFNKLMKVLILMVNKSKHGYFLKRYLNIIDSVNFYSLPSITIWKKCIRPFNSWLGLYTWQLAMWIIKGLIYS